MKQQNKHFYEFGPFRLDIAERILLRDGQHVPLPPKAFDTLLALVENGGHILDKDELLRKVWPDTFVEEVNLAKKVSALRKILGGEHADQYIETIPKRGYRFVAGVREVRVEQAGSVLTAQAGPPAISPEERVSPEERPDQGAGLEPYRPARSETPSALPRSFASRVKWPAAFLALGLVVGVAVWMFI
ncbi:MAG TPA: transcriptional regulator, partial [Blastocatellia bacterium]|nr:transcriptional regulator [Blastocatellia bacterium]